MGASEKLVSEFVSITGSDQGTAKHFLDACSNNLETAVTMFLDGKSDIPGPALSGESSGAGNESEIRAPIPQTTGVLVDDPHYNTTSRDRWLSRRRPRSVFDGFRDFKAEMKHQENLLSNTSQNRSLKRLEDLFRPPLELMHRGTFETARDAGKKQHKWLMVNVQNVREFSCQVLNRDVWSKPQIQSMIKHNFIFWQVYSDSAEGDRFMTFYSISSWPNVSILDPRTGERLELWNEITVKSIGHKVEEFLADHGTMNEEEDEPPSKRSKRDHSVIDDTEDSQLAAAIAASLKDKAAPNDDDFMISNESSDVSEFDASGEEDVTLVEDDLSPNDSDKETSERVTNAEKKLTKNGQDYLFSSEIESTRIEPKYFSGKKSPTKSQNLQQTSNGASQGGKNDKKMYTKVKTKKMKPGTIENGKDFSNLTNDRYGDGDKVKQTKRSQREEVSTPSEVCQIMLRFPDGSREQITMAAHLTVEDLSSKLNDKGFSPDFYEIVTNFPRKNISSSGTRKSLKEVGLFPRAAVFVQERET